MVAGVPAIDQVVAFLRMSDMLGPLPLEARQALARQAEWVSRGAGEPVFRPDDPADSVVIIWQGLVGLFVERPDRRLAPVHVLGPRQTLGWQLLMEADVFPLSPVCLVHTQFLVIPLPAIRRQLRASPEVSGLVYRELGRTALARLHAALALLAGEFQVAQIGVACPFDSGSGLLVQVAFHQGQATGTCAKVGACTSCSCPLAAPRARGYVPLWPL